MLTLDDALAELDKVTPGDIQTLAQELIRDEQLCLSVIAPPRNGAGLRRVTQAQLTNQAFGRSMTERTLILIKPDGVQRALIGKIVDRYEGVGCASRA